MRRIALALCITLLSASTAFAQQVQTTPPRPAPQGKPTTPGAVAPLPQRPATTMPPGQQATTPPAMQAPQTPRPGGAPRDVFAQAGVTPPTGGQNIQVLVTISDSLGGGAQSRKTVSMLVADGRSGQVRSETGSYVINIDARPVAQRDGRIYLQLTVEYWPDLSAQQLQQAGLSRSTKFSESLTLLVPDGKAVIASESSDPRGDRKVSVEVTATVAK